MDHSLGRGAAGDVTDMKRLIILLLCLPTLCPAELIKVPSYVNTANSMPFGLENLDVPSARYQQVYDARAFATIAGAQGGFISEIRFSTVFVDKAFGAVLPDIQISFSTTTRGPDELSEVFSENLGINTITVYGRGELPLSSRINEGFVVRIPLQTPYFYNPTQGNLLLDVSNYQDILERCPLCPVQFDAAGNSGDAVSRVYSLDVTSSTGILSSLGLTTTFEITPIPEPSIWVLCVLGLGIIGLWKSRLVRKGVD